MADYRNVGTKTVTVTGYNNFAGSTLTYTFTIIKLTVVVDASTEQAFLYNGENHNPVYDVRTTIVDEGVSIVLSGGNEKNCGTYASTLSISGPEAKLANYDFETIDISWTIEKRAAYVIAASAWKTFDGSALTASHYELSGILEDEIDDFTITVTGSQTSIGYSVNQITCTTDDDVLRGNYDITCINGTLIVSNPANDISSLTAPVVTHK